MVAAKTKNKKKFWLLFKLKTKGGERKAQKGKHFETPVYVVLSFVRKCNFSGGEGYVGC